MSDSPPPRDPDAGSRWPGGILWRTRAASLRKAQSSTDARPSQVITAYALRMFLLSAAATYVPTRACAHARTRAHARPRTRPQRTRPPATHTLMRAHTRAHAHAHAHTSTRPSPRVDVCACTRVAAAGLRPAGGWAGPYSGLRTRNRDRAVAWPKPEGRRGTFVAKHESLALALDLN